MANLELQPNYRQVQAHYDLSNEFFALFLDRSMTYSCAYFEREDMTLEAAQLAKIDLALGKCDLEPGARLLDIGCGWGSTVRRAVESHGVNAVGLTLSRNQHAYASATLAGMTSAEVRLCGWEEFDEPVDRIVSIGAFEHFRRDRYPEFFARCRRLLPAGGRMLLHTILLADPVVPEQGGEVDRSHLPFAKFIKKKIFPGGQLCPRRTVVERAQEAGFRVAKTQSLQQHYALTLDHWASRLSAARERAIEITSRDNYDTYMHYLTGCASYFRSKHIDVMQFTLIAD